MLPAIALPLDHLMSPYTVHTVRDGRLAASLEVSLACR